VFNTLGDSSGRDAILRQHCAAGYLQYPMWFDHLNHKVKVHPSDTMYACFGKHSNGTSSPSAGRLNSTHFMIDITF